MLFETQMRSPELIKEISEILTNAKPRFQNLFYTLTMSSESHTPGVRSTTQKLHPSSGLTRKRVYALNPGGDLRDAPMELCTKAYLGLRMNSLAADLDDLLERSQSPTQAGKKRSAGSTAAEISQMVEAAEDSAPAMKRSKKSDVEEAQPGTPPRRDDGVLKKKEKKVRFADDFANKSESRRVRMKSPASRKRAFTIAL
eukprot:Blabericola_migrator_1__1282@NODE_1331_length_4785_cov_21_189487_g894_i0_p2_GENE_NODE_1331_length_4785_cov_21_189487_g894_i0NODE_1331_length_4785_cov_21_189487_g894_i0_p2_ORF_typecomplete_len199_score37_66_NODE_1331_length_4785_cov_21_189487_g894_i039964592